jgi:ammonia channel protein AmtB
MLVRIIPGMLSITWGSIIIGLIAVVIAIFFVTWVKYLPEKR